MLQNILMIHAVFRHFTNAVLIIRITGNLALAKAEYQKAIDKSEGLNRKGLDPNRYYVGESLNKMVDMLYEEYKSIELRQPASKMTVTTGKDESN